MYYILGLASKIHEVPNSPANRHIKNTMNISPLATIYTYDPRQDIIQLNI